MLSKKDSIAFSLSLFLKVKTILLKFFTSFYKTCSTLIKYYQIL
nr:MAG TPA: hypothetical protein [Caudoviricetes sp.]